MTRESSWIVLDPLEFDLPAGEFPHESNCRCDFCLPWNICEHFHGGDCEHTAPADGELAVTYNPIADAEYDMEHYGLDGRVFDDNENIAYFARVNAGPYMTRDYYERYYRYMRRLRLIKRNASVYSKDELRAACISFGWFNDNIIAKIHRHAYSQAYW